MFCLPCFTKALTSIAGKIDRMNLSCNLKENSGRFQPTALFLRSPSAVTKCKNMINTVDQQLELTYVGQVQLNLS